MICNKLDKKTFGQMRHRDVWMRWVDTKKDKGREDRKSSRWIKPNLIQFCSSWCSFLRILVSCRPSLSEKKTNGSYAGSEVSQHLLIPQSVQIWCRMDDGNQIRGRGMVMMVMMMELLLMIWWWGGWWYSVEWDGQFWCIWRRCEMLFLLFLLLFRLSPNDHIIS